VTDTGDLSARLAHIVEDCFQSFTNEHNAFQAQGAAGANAIGAYATRVGQYVWLIWGYENVMKTLGLGDAAELTRVAQIRAYVEHTQNEVQALQIRALQASAAQPAAPIGQPVPSWGPTVQMQEAIIKQKQAFDYMNRVRELVLNGGMNMIQAQLIARQETGYSG
jgi:hypothetical protein